MSDLEHPLAERTSHHRGDIPASPDLSEEEQRAARARLAAAYAQENRPPLREEERREREGFVTLPITPEMQALLPRLVPLKGFVHTVAVYGYVIGALVACIGAPLLIQQRFGRAFLTLLAGVATIALFAGLYRALTRWLDANRAVKANEVTSYHRYTGECDIQAEETVWSRWTSKYNSRFDAIIHLDVPPAPAHLARLRSRQSDVAGMSANGAEAHPEWRGRRWRTIEFVTAENEAVVLSVRDERDIEQYAAPHGH